MRTTILLLACILLISCDRTPCKPGLELIPMYGQEKKCTKQAKADQQFISECESQYGSREEACDAMLRFGWKYYAEGDPDKAMKRFNEAWLLDSLDTDVYVGLANVLNDRGDFNKSLEIINKAISIDPNKAKVWKLSGITNEYLYYKTKERKYIERSIEDLKKTISLNKSDAETYTLLANIYLIENLRDSVSQYIRLAEEIDPQAVSEELREKIKQQ